MEEHSNIKSVMCSVLFLDIVEYSRQSVAEQISLKDRFNRHLSAALYEVPMTDRIIFDTGDGAVINFLGDVENALRVALSLRESLLSEIPDVELPLQVRIGANLGPVRLVRDINGHPNIVGDGINVAQRIMGFAQANQIFISRSFYDAVLHLSPQYAGMFHYQGSRTDRQVREHELYALAYPDDEAASQTPGSNIAGIVPDHYAEMPEAARLARNPAAPRQAGSRSRLMYAGAVALIMAITGGLALNLPRHEKIPALPKGEPLQAASGVQQALPVSSAVPAAFDAEDNMAIASRVQPATTLKPDKKKIVVSKPKPGNKQETDQVKRNDAQPKVRAHASEASSNGARNPPLMATGSGAKNSTEAYVSILCTVGTRVFVDGMQKSKLGAEAVMLTLTPGKHLMIVNHPSGNIYSQHVDLEPGRTLHIRPDICK